MGRPVFVARDPRHRDGHSPQDKQDRSGDDQLNQGEATGDLQARTGAPAPTGTLGPNSEYNSAHIQSYAVSELLWAMRDGIDRYKDAADRGAFQIKVGSEGYPPDLDTLVKGI